MTFLAAAAATTALAKMTRLRAEQSGKRDIQFPQDLLAAAAKSKIVADIVANEAQSMKDRWAAYDAGSIQ